MMAPLTALTRCAAVPRVLYFFLFAFLATPGRFTSVFLQKEFGFNEGEVGLVMASPTVISLFSIVAGGVVADSLRKNGETRVLLFCTLFSMAMFHALALVGVHVTGKRALTLCVIVLYTLSRSALSSVMPTLDAYSLRHLAGGAADTTTAKTRWGEERLWGAVSWGIVSVIMGVVYDYAEGFHAVYVARLFTGITFVCCLLSAIFGSDWFSRDDFVALASEEVDLEPPGSSDVECVADSVYQIVDDVEEEIGDAGEAPAPGAGTVKEFVLFLFSRVDSIAFLAVMAALSSGMALVEGLVFLFFAKELQASNFLLGISVAVTVSFEIPIFFASAWLHRTFSGTSMLLMAMFSYSSRVFYYTLVGKEHAWYVLLLEPLHGVTYALSANASVMEMSRLAPPHLQATGQSFLSVAKMVGTILGNAVGGWIMAHYGSVVLYRGAALVIAVAAVVYGSTMRFCSRTAAVEDGNVSATSHTLTKQ